jgi:PAS domain S-box-containing protein
MKASILSKKLEAARKHLDLLHRQSRKEANLPPRSQWMRMLARLSVTLRDLRILVKETCQLNRRLTQTGQALEAEHRRYLELFEFAPDGYLVTDAKGVIQEANRAARALLKARGKGLAGRLLQLYIEEGQRAAFGAQILRLERGSDERMPAGTYRFKPASGAYLDVQLSVAATRAQKGGVTRLRWLMRDITAHRRAVEEIETAHTALERNREELRALAARLMTALEEERRRVSRELHDDLCQRLALLMVEMETLERNLPASPLQVREQLRSFRERAAGLSDDARNLAYRLHPSILEDLGLAVAMRAYVMDFSTREGIRVNLTQKKLPADLPQDIATCLYRVMQESLRNAAKHARTQRVNVMLTGSSHSIRLSTRDWGVGFDPHNSRVRRSGLGLIGMEERVRLMNGTFALHSRPGRGTQVVVHLPLPESSR